VWWNRDRLRKLTAADMGQVFRRVVDGIPENEYLLLLSISPGPSGGPSFITFELDDGKLIRVGETGHFNQPWYKPAIGLSPSIIAEVNRIHEQQVEERLAAIQSTAVVQKAKEREARAVCKRPDSWNLIESLPAPNNPTVTIYVWLEPRGPYVVDFCVASKKIGSRSSPCSHDPVFGMDVSDSERIYGKGGIIDTAFRDPEIAALIT
jgi:hypothetical protein